MKMLKTKKIVSIGIGSCLLFSCGVLRNKLRTKTTNEVKKMGMGPAHVAPKPAAVLGINPYGYHPGKY